MCSQNIIGVVQFIFLVAPCGLIVYLSRGYPGRITDHELLERCGVLDKLRANFEKIGGTIILCGGFHENRADLEQLGLEVLLPPLKEEVLADLTGAKAREARTMDNLLKVPVESMIGRVREFSMLNGHNKVTRDELPTLDCAVQIACGLVNLQPRFAI
jgi:hypothetical protein